jgi:hypothetical protein
MTFATLTQVVNAVARSAEASNDMDRADRFRTATDTLADSIMAGCEWPLK